MTEQLAFPPAMHGEAVTGAPEETAVMRAIQGVDAGLVTYRLAQDRIGAALVFAPEVPLREAMAMFPLCGVGFQNALGALAPPEVAVHLEWGGGLRINGAKAGRMRAFAATSDPEAVPDWLVVSWELALLPLSDDTGTTPDETALFSEGCAEVYGFEGLEVACKTGVKPQARSTIQKSGDQVATEAEGSGPVDAAFKAIEKVANSGADLELYSVNAITAGTEAQGDVTVRLARDGRARVLVVPVR